MAYLAQLARLAASFKTNEPGWLQLWHEGNQELIPAAAELMGLCSSRRPRAACNLWHCHASMGCISQLLVNSWKNIPVIT
jgi:hypothetical protein